MLDVGLAHKVLIVGADTQVESGDLQVVDGQVGYTLLGDLQQMRPRTKSQCILASPCLCRTGKETGNAVERLEVGPSVCEADGSRANQRNSAGESQPDELSEKPVRPAARRRGGAGRGFRERHSRRWGVRRRRATCRSGKCDSSRGEGIGRYSGPRWGAGSVALSRQIC